MAASRPGNPERGWNDPPMFLYKAETQAQQSPKRTTLTQRVGMPQNYPSLANKSTDASGKPVPLLPTSGPPPSGPPPSGPPPSGPPPSGPPSSGPPPSSRNTAPPPTIPSGPPPPTSTSAVKPTSDLSQEELPADLCETTLAKLNLVLESCQDKLQKRIIDDITKKLTILEDTWSKDKLSKPVQQRMGKLATALANQQYDEANEIHLSLMVDYVAEVSQWMVGIKRLIFESKKHLPLVETEDNSDKQQSEEEIDSSKLETLTVKDTPKCEVTEPNDSNSDNVEKKEEHLESDEKTNEVKTVEHIGDSNAKAE